MVTALAAIVIITITFDIIRRQSPEPKKDTSGIRVSVILERMSINSDAVIYVPLDADHTEDIVHCLMSFSASGLFKTTIRSYDGEVHLPVTFSQEDVHFSDIDEPQVLVQKGIERQLYLPMQWLTLEA